MKALIPYAVMALLTASTAALAEGNTLNPPRVYTGIHPPVHKASSFAPHPTARRVYGAPIQAPILKMQPKAKSNLARPGGH